MSDEKANWWEPSLFSSFWHHYFIGRIYPCLMNTGYINILQLCLHVQNRMTPSLRLHPCRTQPWSRPQGSAKWSRASCWQAEVSSKAVHWPHEFCYFSSSRTPSLSGILILDTKAAKLRLIPRHKDMCISLCFTTFYFLKSISTNASDSYMQLQNPLWLTLASTQLAPKSSRRSGLFKLWLWRATISARDGSSPSSCYSRQLHLSNEQVCTQYLSSTCVSGTSPLCAGKLSSQRKEWSWMM